ncbi:hypothetical protein BCR35DRAFT_354330 [Leucosporidium creatinivorum]|uniref:Uncharacterized protein n=1 Tax=Leucosporidium creatinivorum TaxID=106004 RepID=A0A1Y2EN88_9BASI|nr:hypothetical protein BCR35DRAFT_354330 [Leucosporidium creatinivorum]
MASLRATARDDALAVSHLSTLICTGSLAQVIHELRSPLWSPPPSPPPHPALHPSLSPCQLDRPDPLDKLLLTVALEASEWRADALQIFAALLERGADPLARNGDGRRVEWELEGRDQMFRVEWEKAVEARKEGRGYEMPQEMKMDLEVLLATYLVLLQEEDELREEAERAKAAAEAAQMAQKRNQTLQNAVRLTSEPSSKAPSRLPQVAPPSETAPTKRPLVASRLPPAPPKRPRLASEPDASSLPDYDDSVPPRQEPTPEDIKPTLPAPVRPPSRQPSYALSASNSPAPPPSLPPGVSPTFIRIRRLPSWITPPILSHWLEYGAQAFATSPSPEVLMNMLPRGYYKKRVGVRPPRPISVEMGKREGGEGVGGPEEATGGGGGLEAVVAYVGREEAWKAKEGFDAMRVLPLCGEDEMVEVSLL